MHLAGKVALLLTLAGALLVPASSAAAATTYPYAQITAPAGGDRITLGDLIDVDAHAFADPALHDHARTVDLLIDGSDVDTITCAVPASTPDDCLANWDWDTTDYTAGPHTLQAKVTTDAHKVGLSPLVKVTVVDAQVPLPSVVLGSPLPGPTVVDQTYVVATGSVTQASGDVPYGMVLVVDGQQVGPTVVCAARADLTCTQALLWDATGLSGQHSVAVTFITALHQVTTAPVTVTVTHPLPPVAVSVPPLQPAPISTTVSLAKPLPVLRGDFGVVHGSVTNIGAGAAVHLVFTPLHGAARSVNVVTNADGTFAAVDPDRLRELTTVLASTGPSLGSSSAVGRLTVRVVITCHATSRVHHGRAATIVCTTPGLAAGTIVTLHYAQDGHGTVTGKVAKGSVRLALRVAAKGLAKVWATTAASVSFAASASRTYAVAVR